MAKQGKLKTDVGEIEWDLIKGDITWEGIPVYVNGRQCKIEDGVKRYTTHTECYIQFVDPDKGLDAYGRYKRYELEVSNLNAYLIRAQVLGPRVAQIPNFATGAEENKENKKVRKERMEYLFNSMPEIENWFVYLTCRQSWHTFVEDYGFVQTQRFFNPNSENMITEYYLAR